jgi:hypothetical protein
MRGDVRAGWSCSRERAHSPVSGDHEADAGVRQVLAQPTSDGQEVIQCVAPHELVRRAGMSRNSERLHDAVPGTPRARLRVLLSARIRPTLDPVA